MPAVTAVTIALFGVLGLFFGSWANIVIRRVPAGGSPDTLTGNCAGCDAPISWVDALPLISYFRLAGKCRDCGSPIPVRYPLTEISTAALWVFAAAYYGPSIRASFAAALFSLLLILTQIDIETRRLPNPIVGLTAIIGVAGVLVSTAGALFGTEALSALPLLNTTWSPLLNGILGPLFTAGPATVIALLYILVRGKSGFGAGDIKLLMALGFFFGAHGLLILPISAALSIVGIIVGSLGGKRFGLTSEFPYGPYIALAAMVVAIWGEQMVAAYLNYLLG